MCIKCNATLLINSVASYTLYGHHFQFFQLRNLRKISIVLATNTVINESQEARILRSFAQMCQTDLQQPPPYKSGRVSP